MEEPLDPCDEPDCPWEQPDWPIHLVSLNTISTFYLATYVCTVFPPILSEEIITMHL